MVAAAIHGLPAAATQAGDGAAVILTIGAVNSSATALLNDVLDLDLPLPRQPRAAPAHSGLCAAASSGGPLALVLEGLDPADRDAAADVESAVTVGVALAGVLVVVVRQPDLVRPASSALGKALQAVQRSLAMRASGITGPLPTRRLLVVAVRDYDPEEVAAGELKSFVSAYLSDAYEAFENPPGFAATQFSDLFDVHFALLPNERLDVSRYGDEVDRLGGVLRDANRDFADAGMTPDGLLVIAGRVQNALADETGGDLPPDQELRATFACDSVMKAVLEKYRNTAKQWKATVEAGRIIRNFGKESDTLVSRTLEVYDRDAIAEKQTRAYGRKKEELKAYLLGDAYALFGKQILKLREVAYQVFRGKLARIRINEKVEKNVRGAVKEAEAYFVENAESLRSNLGAWRFDNERHELVNHMRDDATERLQHARLQGNYVPPMRAPVAFAFHTLLAAPFGRDSRSSQPHAEDMQQKFDPDKVKKAGLSRPRPEQRRFKIAVGAREAADISDFDQLAPLFEDVQLKK